MGKQQEQRNMLSITQALRAVLKDEDEGDMHARIGLFLGAGDDDQVCHAFDELIGPACDVSAYSDRINQAFATGVVAATLDTVCEDWCDVLDPGVRTTELDSVVGLRCLQLIIRADMLAEDMADVRVEFQAALKASVARQCQVFLYG